MTGNSVDLEALKHIALMGGIRGEVSLTTATLAKSIDITQQGASKRIISMEQRGWIRRRVSTRTQHVRVTPLGKETLLREYASYQQIFSPVSTVDLEGEVVPGMGRGEQFISMPEYREQFTRILGSTPYDGTLNVKVSHFDTDKLSIIRGRGGRTIEGFSADGHIYGAASCFRAEIRKPDGPGVECILVLPTKSAYRDIIELVSHHHLRRSMHLEDGARVQVFVQL